MNSTISPMNNVNFQAKLNVADLSGANKVRLQNIAKIFEEKTKKYSNDTIFLSGKFGDTIYWERMNNKQNWIEDDAILEPALTKALKKLSDNEIAKKLVAILKFSNKQAMFEEKTEKFAKALSLNKADIKTETEFYYLMSELSSLRNADFKKKNPIFQKGLII